MDKFIDKASFVYCGSALKVDVESRYKLGFYSFVNRTNSVLIVVFQAQHVLSVLSVW